METRTAFPAVREGKGLCGRGRGAGQHGVTMGTHLAVAEGAQFIIAWRRDELHEDEVLRAMKGPVPSLDRLRTV